MKMTEAMSPLPKDAPVMIAWEAYKVTDGYANTRNWALNEKHVDGSLWAAFLAGHEARTLSLPSDQEVEKVARAISLEFDVDPDVFIGMHGRAKWEEQWHSIAHAALLAIRQE
jgi:hypothetical protein